jgi:anaerobic ribonucleoside-triphosphate reductase
MAYKIQPLVEAGYDFKAVYPEKQRTVREATNLDFYLDGIVQFLQRTTNNFTIENSIAHDLDDAIFNIVEKYKAENPSKDEEPMPMPEPMPEPTEEEKKQEWLEAIELLEMLGEDLDEEAKEALELLKSLV